MPVHTTRKYFDASAVGFGGIIGKIKGKPNEILVDSLGVSALAGAGGRHSNVATRRDIPENLLRWVDFDRISVRTEGRFTETNSVYRISESKHKTFDEGTLQTTTTTEVVIENLSILGGIFRAGLVKARMVAQLPGPTEDNPIFVDGPAFENVTIRGQRVEVVIDHGILGASTMEKLDDAHKRCSDQFFHPKPDSRIGALIEGVFQDGPHKNVDDAVHYTFVTQIKGDKYHSTREFPNVVEVDDFGQVAFGEVIAGANRRHVTMLRFALGSEEGANFSSGDMKESPSWSP